MMEISQRIAFARKQKDLSQTQLASMLGISRGACGQWERGVTVPSVINLSKLAWHLDIHFEWLATGRGQMDYDANDQVVKAVFDDSISPDQKEMLAVYSALLFHQKSALLNFIKTLK
ncbi:MAG: helix-turn-helix domain-containing protein [Ghiorsea sp.]